MEGLGDTWAAKWIGPSADPREELGAFRFRCGFVLDHVPDRMLARFSGDRRFRLFLNEVEIAQGPQPGDARHWHYDTLDLRPWLRAGSNALEAVVWNYGRWSPMAHIGVRTAWLFEAERSQDVLNTPGEWVVQQDLTRGFAMMHAGSGEYYIDVGPGETFDPDRGFGPPARPHLICNAENEGRDLGGTPWMLRPRPVRVQLVQRRGKPPTSLPSQLLPGVSAVMDFGELLCGFPKVELTGAPGAQIRIVYDEALWAADGSKGNRNEIAGKDARGYLDILTIGRDGHVRFEPLWWRTFRFVTLEADSPAALVDFQVDETGYPFESQAKFQADDPLVREVWDVGLRTVKRCLGETYFDCPYYEQLQYIGDTRLQALIGYYLSGEREMQRHAIDTLSWSLMDSGFLQSRYPSRQAQVIPPFSLWWIVMLHDGMLFDRAPVNPRHLEIAEGILKAWRQLEEGDPSKAHWCFADWTPEWQAGVPPGGPRAPVHRYTAQYAQACLTNLLAGELVASPDAALREPASPESPSEHAEAMRRVAQQALGQEADPWPDETPAANGAAECSYYFAYYKHLAMLPADYLAQLGPWSAMIGQGLTTFAENPEPTRSDCHAWSAHPLLGFFQLIAGVTSVAAGWRRARIEPRPGRLKSFEAVIPHPDGSISVQFDHGELEVDCPVPFDLVWRGKSARLEPGRRRF